MAPRVSTAASVRLKPGPPPSPHPQSLHNAKVNKTLRLSAALRTPYSNDMSSSSFSKARDVSFPRFSLFGIPLGAGTRPSQMIPTADDDLVSHFFSHSQGREAFSEIPSATVYYHPLCSSQNVAVSTPTTLGVSGISHPPKPWHSSQVIDPPFLAVGRPFNSHFPSVSFRYLALINPSPAPAPQFSSHYHYHTFYPPPLLPRFQSPLSHHPFFTTGAKRKKAKKNKRLGGERRNGNQDRTKADLKLPKPRNLGSTHPTQPTQPSKSLFRPLL
ncbi:hypothetical protein N658DRAFT_101501 [Parathielavia hyrcaniae]|uniref:Uncharacterized protein n=1 Tax=Parathielavia hyrcaniae TaxID=113614 RepID=A0AAN6PYY4_9PEZI|nr:hypothetical protein N658DRAFT_101501 [Parathielavia hyrcaniae]